MRRALALRAELAAVTRELREIDRLSLPVVELRAGVRRARPLTEDETTLLRAVYDCPGQTARFYAESTGAASRLTGLAYDALEVLRRRGYVTRGKVTSRDGVEDGSTVWNPTGSLPPANER